MTSVVKGIQPKEMAPWVLLFAFCTVLSIQVSASAPLIILLLPLILSVAVIKCGVFSFIPYGLCYLLIVWLRHYSLLAVVGVTLYAVLLATAIYFGIQLKRAATKRLMAYVLALLMGVLGFVPWLHSYVGEELLPGIADKAVAYVQEMPSCDDFLVQMLSSGQARLSKELLAKQQSYSSITQLFTGSDKIVLLAEVRTALLSSVHTTLMLKLPTILPRYITLFIAIGAIVLLMLPVVLLRRSGVKVMEPPPIVFWHMDKQTAKMGYAMLIASIIISITTADGALNMFAVMLQTLFSVLFVVQGLAVMEFMQMKSGMSRLSRRISAIITVLLVWFIPVLIAVADERIDFRGLRPKKKEEDE